MINSDGQNEKEKYRAPALERGLEVLELLASEQRSLTLDFITERLGRSISQLYRVLHVLSRMGYISKTKGSESVYTITSKLLMLGMSSPSVNSLIDVAIPIIREMTNSIGQSCHIAVPSSDQIVVIYRMEAKTELGFSVRTGYRRSIASATSGSVLFAFQPEEVQQQWLKIIQHADPTLDTVPLISRSSRIAEQGYQLAPSDFVRGITDISVPIMTSNRAIAALTIPFVETTPLKMQIEDTIPILQKTAVAIGKEMALNQNT